MSPRHARPRGRRALETAYGALLGEAAALRSRTGEGNQTIDELRAVVQALSAQVQMLVAERAQVRREIAEVRTAPASDPLLVLLMSQFADLREQLAASNRLIADLTDRLSDPVAPLAVAVPRPASPVPEPAVPEPSPLYAELVPERVRVPAYAGPAPEVGSAYAGHEPEVDVRPEPARVRAYAGQAVEPAVDAAVERLRLIRKSLEG